MIYEVTLGASNNKRGEKYVFRPLMDISITTGIYILWFCERDDLMKAFYY